jgi:hypothetical protein
VVTFLFDTDAAAEISYCSPVLTASQVLAPYESTLTALDYLNFAVSDSRESIDRAFINAIGNSKRAIHLAIDETLHQYGLFMPNRNLTFPGKIELLSTAGIMSIDILKRLNIERNLVEHEYRLPSRTAVVESIDIARLLILAFGRLTDNVVVEWLMGVRRPARQHLLARLNQRGGTIDLYRLSAAEGRRLRFSRRSGVSHVVGLLRNPMTGAWNDAFVVAERPARSIDLRLSNSEEWMPYLELVLRMQELYTLPPHPSQRSLGMSTIGFHVVVPYEYAVSWADAVGRSFAGKPESADSGAAEEPQG